ncbi:MAG TPA: serine hydrolase domain-containing protein [Bacteroidales bacterium]|nr:serine hydrolase domain-containing protein [Bacteroidales bacterium]
MNRKPVFLLFFYLLFAGALLNALPVQSQKSKKPAKPLEAKDVFDLEKLKRIDVLLKNAIATEALPSAVCLITFRGEPIYFKAFGDAVREDKGKALTKDALFRNASQTKLVTTVALMTMFQDGMFSLEDPVKKYLPEFANPVVLVSGSAEAKNLVTRPAKSDITIRQLLSHSSGIGYNSYGQDLEVIRYANQISTAEAVSRIAKLPLRHDPGEGFTYGYGLDVAGRLAEVISGMRLDSLIKLRVLTPLAMENTWFYLPKNQQKRLVPVYTKPDIDSPIMLADSLDRFYPMNPAPIYFGGGAGLCGTIEDYSHLCQMILNMGIYNGKRFLNRKIVEMMTTDQLFGANGNHPFGLGLEIATQETFARTMRTPGSLRWGGYYATEYLIDPKYQVVALLYSNKMNWYKKQDVWGDLLRIMYMSLLR